MRVLLGATAVLVAGLLTGCADSSGTVRIGHEIPSGRTPYAGSLVSTPSPAEKEHPLEWPGAAGDVVECSTPPHGQTVLGTNTAGAVASDPQQAIRVKMGEGLFLDAPSDELVMERDDGDRVLFTTSYDGVARQALIVRDGPSGPGTGAKHGHGWFVESFAACDLADFPERVSADRGVQVWTDRNGVRIATTTVVSAPGPQHCGWEAMTFLTFGDGARDPVSYVEQPAADLHEYFDLPYRAHVAVPDDATDTGFRRDGRSLWLSADERYAYVGTEADAAAWPRELKRIGCA
jgi:hypothetical protein